MPRRKRPRAARAAGPVSGRGNSAVQAPPAEAEADGVLRLLEPGVEDFARRLLDPARERPVIVVSIPGDRDRPWIDVDEVESAVRGLADVVLLADDAASWALTPLLPEKTQVYGGAGRVYPVGTDWRADPTVAPLRFAYDENGGARAAARLTQDALVMASRTLSVRLAPAEARSVHGCCPPSRMMTGASWSVMTV